MLAYCNYVQPLPSTRRYLQFLEAYTFRCWQSRVRWLCLPASSFLEYLYGSCQNSLNCYQRKSCRYDRISLLRCILDLLQTVREYSFQIRFQSAGSKTWALLQASNKFKFEMSHPEISKSHGLTIGIISLIGLKTSCSWPVFSYIEN